MEILLEYAAKVLIVLNMKPLQVGIAQVNTKIELIPNMYAHMSDGGVEKFKIFIYPVKILLLL